MWKHPALYAISAWTTFLIYIIISILLQFDGFIDLESYDTIALKVKGDGRCYISTVSF